MISSSWLQNKHKKLAIHIETLIQIPQKILFLRVSHIPADFNGLHRITMKITYQLLLTHIKSLA